MKQLLSHFMHKSLCFLARLCIKRHKPFVIGITGSFGKTTARHIITEILHRASKRAWTPEGNYNGEWGLALAVLQVRSGGQSFTGWIQTVIGALNTLASREYPDILVLEYGVAHYGEMDVQINIVEPDIALFTKLSPSHTQGFENVDQYYAEKEKILRRAHVNTYAIGNGDDRHQADFLCQQWYGMDILKNDLVIEHVSEFADRTEADFVFHDKRFHIVSPILGGHHMGLLAGAFLVACQVGIPPLDTVSFFRHIHLPHARGNILKGLHDSLVIDGTYNGGFDPIIAGVDMLSRLARAEGRKSIALLGDMRELGVLERARHEELWHQLRDKDIDHFIFVGAVSMEIIKPLVDERWREKTFFTLDSRAAGEYIRALLAADPDKYLLFAKGSQNTIYLEEALKYFIFPEEYLKLVRQEDLYVRKKGDFYRMLDIG